MSPLSAHGRRGPWAVGGIAAVLLIAWVLTGDTATVRRAADSDPEALELLRGTATAARRTPYEGTWTRTTLLGGRPSTTVTRVVHETEAPAVLHDTSLQSASAVSGRPGEREGGVVAGGGLPGFTRPMLTQLARNYTVVRAADDTVCGRTARVVEARRADGSTAGRFWIDTETGILLRRELLDGDRVVSATGFSELRLTRPRVPETTDLLRAEPWRPVDAAGLADLRERGWTVPQALPGGFALHEVRRSDDDGTLHLGYSDGLAAMSVFVQRGRLNIRRLSGWRRTTVEDRTVFHREARQRWAVWAGDGYVYTVLTDAPQTTSDAVVAAFPRNGTKLWGRLLRGARRIGTWAVPWN